MAWHKDSGKEAIRYLIKKKKQRHLANSLSRITTILYILVDQFFQQNIWCYELTTRKPYVSNISWKYKRNLYLGTTRWFKETDVHNKVSYVSLFVVSDNLILRAYTSQYQYCQILPNVRWFQIDAMLHLILILTCN